MTTSTLEAKPGLLIIAHGAPREQWNLPVLELGRKVAEEAAKVGRFGAVRTAMLEFTRQQGRQPIGAAAPVQKPAPAGRRSSRREDEPLPAYDTQPDVAGAVAQLEAQGCKRIVAVPLFVAPSGHSLFDVPAVLGLHSSPRANARIAERGGRVTAPKVPVTLTGTLHEGDILGTFSLDQLRILSVEPAEEALVLIAHGDADHRGPIERLMRRITTYCCGRAGIDWGNWAFVGVGRGYLEHGCNAIADAAKHKQRVLVVGVYVSSSALDVHQRAMAKARTQPDFPRIARFFEENAVLFSRQALVAHPGAVGWVLRTAHDAL